MDFRILHWQSWLRLNTPDKTHGGDFIGGKSVANMKFFLQTEQAKANAVLLACASCHCHRGGDTEGTQPPGAAVQPAGAWPYIHCFSPLWPNRLVLFLTSWWSERHKHSLGAVTKSCPGWGSCLRPGQLQFPRQGCPCSVPQDRKLLGYTVLRLPGASLTLWAARAGNAACCATGETWK